MRRLDAKESPATGQRIIAVMKTDPTKGWTAGEIASRIQDNAKKVATTLWLMTKKGDTSKGRCGLPTGECRLRARAPGRIPSCSGSF